MKVVMWVGKWQRGHFGANRGHLVLTTGSNHLGLFKAQFLKECPQELKPFIYNINRWERTHETVYSSTDQNLMEETKVKDSISNYIQMGIDTQMHAKVSPQILAELNEEEIELQVPNS